MARFCTKCGRPLKEGEVCNCTAQNAGGAQNAGASQGQPGGRQNYQQGQPGGRQNYQQGQPGGRKNSEFGQPGGQQYYQQGQPGGQQYYQQASRSMKMPSTVQTTTASSTATTFGRCR